MTEKLATLPIADADRHAREQIEYHREQMAVWRRARAHRMAAERETRSVEDIAAELGISTATVYEVLRAAKS
ncbi:helix-turn-helix domain-containing protein [Plantactinospora sp. WMMB334]|uniref:helix-turn-helix domain-containing protein n=1 Tax=Plantactinospora sp. WMMB334 TaxID=3404119 RepID=UPI003B957859